MLDCSALPTVSASTVEAGGHFQADPSQSDCTVHGLLPQEEALCLDRAQPSETGIEMHSLNYSQADHLGGWAITPVSGGQLTLALGTLCLTAPATAIGTAMQLSACSGSQAQRFVIDVSSQEMQLAADASRCVGWGVPPPTPASFVVETGAAGERQDIWGFGFEIQSDSIGSDNNGMPNSTSSVPHDLTLPERARFYSDMLKGFRYCRLALGLYLRGLTPDDKHIIGRWPTQMAELKALQDQSGIEGFEVEYWSPAPAWKSSQSWYSGTLGGFDDEYLANFTTGVLADNQYLTDQGLKIAWWGLQNEPNFDEQIITPAQCASQSREEQQAERDALVVRTPVSGANSYSRCQYTQCDYWRAFRAVAPAVKKALPGVKIHANSARGQLGASPVALDPESGPLVDGWTWHFIGADSSLIFNGTTINNMSLGKPSFENEFEYQPSEFRYNASMANTVAFIFNWLVFAESPTFYWIHALKPSTNVESVGYGLGIWRPANDTNFTHYPEIQPGHWDWDPYNWNAMAPFARFIPWDSTRVNIIEDTQRPDQRVLAFRTPADPSKGGPLHAFKTPPQSLAFAVVNKDPINTFSANFTFDDAMTRTVYGHRFSAAANDTLLGAATGSTISVTVPPLSSEFWLTWQV